MIKTREASSSIKAYVTVSNLPKRVFVGRGELQDHLPVAPLSFMERTMEHRGHCVTKTYEAVRKDSGVGEEVDYTSAQPKSPIRQVSDLDFLHAPLKENTK